MSEASDRLNTTLTLILYVTPATANCNPHLHPASRKLRYLHDRLRVARACILRLCNFFVFSLLWGVFLVARIAFLCYILLTDVMCGRVDVPGQCDGDVCLHVVARPCTLWLGRV